MGNPAGTGLARRAPSVGRPGSGNGRRAASPYRRAGHAAGGATRRPAGPRPPAGRRHGLRSWRPSCWPAERSVRRLGVRQLRGVVVFGASSPVNASVMIRASTTGSTTLGPRPHVARDRAIQAVVSASVTLPIAASCWWKVVTARHPRAAVADRHSRRRAAKSSSARGVPDEPLGRAASRWRRRRRAPRHLARPGHERTRRRSRPRRAGHAERGGQANRTLPIHGQQRFPVTRGGVGQEPYHCGMKGANSLVGVPS
jgi:hypothetical protein